MEMLISSMGSHLEGSLGSRMRHGSRPLDRRSHQATHLGHTLFIRRTQ